MNILTVCMEIFPFCPIAYRVRLVFHWFFLCILATEEPPLPHPTPASFLTRGGLGVSHGSTLARAHRKNIHQNINKQPHFLYSSG